MKSDLTPDPPAPLRTVKLAGIVRLRLELRELATSERRARAARKRATRPETLARLEDELRRIQHTRERLLREWFPQPDRLEAQARCFE